MPGGDNSNGRITMAVLAQKLDALIDTVKQGTIETREWRQRTEDRMRIIERLQDRLDEQVQGTCKDITELRSHSNRWDMLVGAASALGATIAGLLGGRQ